MPSPLAALRILLVDDNTHMRKIVAAVLRAIGVQEIEECGDGPRALTLLREWGPHMAIIDYNMTPMDGAELTRLIRQSPESANPYLPIIMLTGYSEKMRVELARDAGVNEFIVKPVTAQAIISRMNMLISKPRPFIRSEDYFGPDRRRRTLADYEGPFRRKDDPQAQAQAQDGDKPTE